MEFKYLTEEMMANIFRLHQKKSTQDFSAYCDYFSELVEYVISLPIEAQVDLYQLIYIGSNGSCAESFDEILRNLEDAPRHSWENLLRKGKLIEYLEAAKRHSRI